MSQLTLFLFVFAGRGKLCVLRHKKYSYHRQRKPVSYTAGKYGCYFRIYLGRQTDHRNEFIKTLYYMRLSKLNTLWYTMYIDVFACYIPLDGFLNEQWWFISSSAAEINRKNDLLLRQTQKNERPGPGQEVAAATAAAAAAYDAHTGQGQLATQWDWDAGGDGWDGGLCPNAPSGNGSRHHRAPHTQFDDVHQLDKVVSWSGDCSQATVAYEMHY